MLQLNGLEYGLIIFDQIQFSISYLSFILILLLFIGWPDLAARGRSYGGQEEKDEDYVGAGKSDPGAVRLEHQAGQAGALPPGQTEPWCQGLEVDRAWRQQPDCPCAAMIWISNLKIPQVCLHECR